LHGAAGINNRGDVVGDAGDGLRRLIEPFIWTAGSGMRGLGPAPDGFEWYVGRTVNDQRRILAGLRELDTLAVRTAVVSPEGAVTIVPAIVAGESMLPVDIDNTGRVIGDFQQVSFSWKPGALPIVRFAATPHRISAMNDGGRVAGSTGMIDISDGSDTQSDCTGINDAGEVVGVRDLDQSACYWSASTGPREPIDLVDPADPLKATYTGFSPRAINQSGQVLVMARRADSSGNPAMLVLTPRR
jgi:hypothetical protein